MVAHVFPDMFLLQVNPIQIWNDTYRLTTSGAVGESAAPWKGSRPDGTFDNTYRHTKHPGPTKKHTHEKWNSLQHSPRLSQITVPELRYSPHRSCFLDERCFKLAYRAFSSLTEDLTWAGIPEYLNSTRKANIVSFANPDSMVIGLERNVQKVHIKSYAKALNQCLRFVSEFRYASKHHRNFRNEKKKIDPVFKAFIRGY